jgi:superfamily II DNA helicase RecQ
MPFRFFTVPIRSSAAVELELNAFLASHRVLSVERKFVDQGENSFWVICVDHLEATSRTSTPSFDRKGRVDYRELLSAEDFAAFSQLRALRKEVAQDDAVPVYAIFTNEQLAEMVRRRVGQASDLQSIDGVGEARVAKYGERFVDCLRSFIGTD